MLIGNSFPKLVFIRSVILSLRLIAPAGVLYCLIFPTVRPQQFFRRSLLLPFSIWAISEFGFLLIAYLPLKLLLQQDAIHPEPPSRFERRLLFQRCLESVPDRETYIFGWFLGSPLSQIKRENLKEFYAWSLMNKKYEDIDNEEATELENYADQLEEKFGRKLESGSGQASSLRGTLESVYMQHRPLVWYLVSRTLEDLHG